MLDVLDLNLDEYKSAIKFLCELAHINRVDITITFAHDGTAEIKVEPTYWDKERSE